MRTWLKREDVDAGRVEGVSSEEREELRRLRREVRVLREEREILKKAAAFRQGERDPVAVFRFIWTEKANHSVQTMCRVLEVSRSGYYAWAARPPSERAVANAALLVEIRRVHGESDGTYGSRRVHAQLRRDGREVNVKRVERLMRVEGIQGAYVPAKRRRGGEDGVLGVDGVRIWPDLVKRDFRPDGPNQLWCSDMEQIPTGEGSCTSRRCWTVSAARLSGGRWARSLTRRWSLARCRWLWTGAGRARESSITPIAGVNTRLSRSAPRAAPTVSRSPTAARAARTTTPRRRASSPHWRRRLRNRTFQTMEQARSSVFQYIEEFYNRRRLHSTLGYRSPEEAERDHQQATLTLVA